MEVLYARCCGIDVHKESLVACLRQIRDRVKAANRVHKLLEGANIIVPASRCRARPTPNPDPEHDRITSI